MKQQPRRTPSDKAKKEMFLIIGLTLLFMFVYFGAGALPYPTVGFITTGLYMSALLVTAVVYISYNYAFTRKDLSPDMLPDDWDEQKKHDFIESGKEHFKKSRWMIFIIFPLAITFLADVLYLFVWTGFLENFFK